MSFQDLNLKPSYSSSRNNLIDEFYVPVLKESVKYDRTTGFFTSRSLASIADGLKDFIRNNGKMRLLCGAQLDYEDIESIINAEDISKTLSDNFLDELSNVKDEIQLNRLKLLAWMVDNEFLEIKIGIVKSNSGLSNGMLHEKTGILYDKHKNCIVFSGSNNETEAGWSSEGFGNLEKFKVFSSWEDSKFIENDISDFEDDWDNKNNYLDVIDVPSAAKEGLISLSPKTKKEVYDLPLSYVEKYLNEVDSKDERELRDYQEKAVNDWVDNGKRGILDMTTSSGKTFIAMNCISRVLDVTDNEGLVTIIACHSSSLVEQWTKDVENFFNIPCFQLCRSLNTNWEADLRSISLKLNKLPNWNNVIILTTHNTFSKHSFLKKVSKFKQKTLLVVDEVHHVSAPSFKEGLNESYEYRLGLSATPYNHYSDSRNDLLLGYFGGVVSTFSTSEGLTTFDENHQSVLAPYEYIPWRVDLSSNELQDYRDLTFKIRKQWHMNKDEDSTYYSQLLNFRKNIVKNAELKYDCLREILKSKDDWGHLLVFCSPQQKKKVLTILKEEGVSPRHQFTKDESTNKSERYGGRSFRQYLIDEFDRGFYKALVAIKCLDEGMNIPSADKIILMSSSTDPREYIQRRGRVLRRCEGKEKAVIYDIAVIPSEIDEFTEGLIEGEKERLIEFITLSINPEEGFEFLDEWGI